MNLFYVLTDIYEFFQRRCQFIVANYAELRDC
jgi:hypothetical protein